MNKFISFLFLFLLNVTWGKAQVTMEVNAPATVDLSEEYFQLQFIINESSVSDFTPPALSDFEVLSGPYSSVRSSTSYVNGKSTHESSTTYTYMISPLKKGKFTIGSASAVVHGKTVHSQPRTIEVTGDGKPRNNTHNQGPSSPSSSNVKITDKDLFIHVSANRTKIYEQEPVTLTYKFYAQPNVMLSQIGLQKKPDFKGMLSQDIPVTNIQVDIEEINGQSFRSGVIQKYVIFPQGAGKITIPGITFNCDVMQRDLSIDPIEAFFNGGGTISRTLQRRVADIDLEILPLPLPKPEGFSGGVGQFTIKGEWLTDEFKTNDVATYRITVAGTGNLKLLTAPKLELSEDFDQYNPKVTDNTRVTAQGITGNMVYDYTLVPRKVGDYKMPALDFCYFDPTTEKYVTIHTAEQNLHVVKGERSNEEYQRSQNLQRSDIKDLHNSVGATSPMKESFWWGDWTYWLIYLLIAVIGHLLYLMFHRFAVSAADTVSRNSRRAAKMATRRMKQAKSFMVHNQRENFYTEVAHALYGYVAHKYNISQADLNRTRIEAQFTEKGVSSESVTTFLHLLDECDFAQYAPSNQVMSMEKMYNSAIAAIVEIEKQK